MVNRENLCPVCGFDLGYMAWDGDSPSDEICPSCGIQFGYNDAAGSDAGRRNTIHEKWRRNWVRDGMPWTSKGMPKPAGWDPATQLKSIVSP